MKYRELLQKAAAAARSAREIAEKAEREGREMTDDERSDFDAKHTEAVKAKEDADAAKKDQDVLDQMKSIADEVGAGEQELADAAHTVNGEGGTKQRAEHLGLQVVKSDQYKQMMEGFGGRVPDGARVHSQPIPVKALLTGGSDTSGGAFVTPDQTGIVEMLGRRPLRFRDLISVRRTGSDSVEYVRQTSHTNNAAPVPEATSSDEIGDGATETTGGVKPEGSWAFERVTENVVTIAEWVPATKRALSDVAALEGLIRDELEADLAEAEEDQMVTGDGSGENLTGLLNVSGTQAQAFDTDIFVTTRKALTKVRTNGRAVPNGIALHPADAEKVELARDNNDRFYGNGPFAMGPRTLWGVPYVDSEAVTEGSAIVADFRKAVLWDREQASVTMTDSHADFFIRNLVAILGEERVAFGVTRPTAFVVASLTASGS